MTSAEAESVISCANDQAVWPWQAEPYKLWSMQDMEMFQVNLVALFAAALGEGREQARLFQVMPGMIDDVSSVILQKATENITASVREKTGGKVNLNFVGNEVKIQPALDEKILPYLRKQNTDFWLDTQKVAGKLKLPARWDAKVKRIVESIEHDDAKTIQVRLEDLIHDFCEALTEPIFLYVSPAHRQFFEQVDPLFGASVADKFPDATRDIAAAGRCFALDEWTACVFHAMRVLEHGLRKMATRFSVPFATDSWHAVIKGIEDGITALRNKKPLAEDDRKEITYYSEAAAQFRHIKDAWRNHVTHAREFYDERDAKGVLEHVRELMQHLATDV